MSSPDEKTAAWAICALLVLAGCTGSAVQDDTCHRHVRALPKTVSCEAAPPGSTIDYPVLIWESIDAQHPSSTSPKTPTYTHLPHRTQTALEDVSRALPTATRTIPQKDVPQTDWENMFTEADLSNLRPMTEHEINTQSEITGDDMLDAQIVQEAVGRGYMYRPIVEDTSYLEATDGIYLQPQAKSAWEELKDSASVQGYEMRLLSGYRSPKTQLKVFLRHYDPDLPDDRVREDLFERLRLSALPGMSKHQTGYAVDIGEKGYAGFEKSPVFIWLEADNYANALRHGWVPSYPEGYASQGPDPEFWEYVFIGKAPQEPYFF